MPETVTPVAQDLVEYLTNILQPLFDEKRVVVWYDREGALEAPLRAAAALRGWTMVPALGARNPLAARADIEDQILKDGLQLPVERRWLVYVPCPRQDPSWYEDLELLGRAVQQTLAEVIAGRHGLPPSVATLVKDRVARRLVQKWDEVFPNGTLGLDLDALSAALLALALGEPGPLAPRAAVLRFLRDPSQTAATLQAEGLGSTFVQIVRTQLGFGRLPEGDEVRPTLLVRAMLASELVHRGACETALAINNYLPQKNHLATWAGMAEAAVRDVECQPSFCQLAREVEAEVNLVQHASDLHALAQVASLPSVDDRLLEEVAARCSPPGGRNSASLGELARWAEERLKLARLGIAVAEDWVVVADASRLLTGCETAERELAALQAPSADELIRRYADPNDGWWRLDDLHRGLELRFDACRSGIVEHLGQPAVAALWKWSRQLAQQFADAFERSGGYAAPADVIPHHRFWSELVETGDLGETAILYVDALRLDLAEKLIGLLSQPGRTVTRRLALGSLPSKTPVGMASLLPRRGQSLVVLAKREKLRAEIGGRDVSDRPDRVAHLRQAVANLEVGELKQITESQLRAWAIARRPVLLTTLDIDNSGEIAATVAPKLFEDLIADLARWVTVLHRAGYRRVAIGTDHGFLLVPEGVSLGDVPAPQKASDVAISTRYAVGPLQTPNGCLGFDASALGYGGTARVVVPKGLTAFSVAGPRHRFIHGGLSPQECLLRFVISTQAGPPKAPVQVRLAPVPNVASLILYLQAEVTSSHGSAQARRVRVEARHGSRVVGRSDIVVYKPELELGPAEAYPRIKVTLTEPVPAVDLILLDEDSGDELDSQLGVPNVMRREADEDLL